MSVVLVVAAHPDDEILGVGATISKRIKLGDIAYALILGEGQTSRFKNRELANVDLVNELHKDTLKAAKVIGFKDVFFESIADNRFDSVDLLDVVKCVEKHVENLKPDIIYTHHGGDLNIDHQITHKAVLTATRPIGDYSVKEIYAFETVSSTEWNFASRENAFIPNMFVDISEQFDIKCRAMEAYRSELCEYPHPRSLRMLKCIAEKWGGTVGVEYAEAFETIRVVK